MVIGQLLSSEQESEGVATIVGGVNFSDLNSVISQVVVDNEGQVFGSSEEAEDLSVVVQELLLGGDFTATEGLFEELLHLTVTLGGNSVLRLAKGIIRSGLSGSLGLTDVLFKANDG